MDQANSPITLDPAFDSRSFTIMSYSAQAGNEHSRFSYEPTTPMILDIAAIQHLYGANMEFNSGNTNYVFTSGRSYHQTIWDAGGTDTFTYSSRIGGEIDLNAGLGGGSLLGVPVIATGAAGQFLYQAYNVWIAANVLIENAVGGSGSDLIIGNNAANRIDGGAGSDTMRGGAGNDTYVVNTVSDVIQEMSTRATEIDTVQSSVSWTLGANLERLQLTGSNAINGTGNKLVNTLTGNAGSNILDGGSGIDILAGGKGNDTYIVGSVGERITELSGAGVDSVRASISWALGSSLENLVLTGTATNGTGNSQSNTLIGNSAANTLRGMSGKDTLDGGWGKDTLFGGTGLDTFRFTTRASTSNSDRIGDFKSADDRILLENAVYSKLGAAGKLASSSFFLGEDAHDASDRVIYDFSTGRLFYDSDGSGDSARILVATLGAKTSVTLDDLWIN